MMWHIPGVENVVPDTLSRGWTNKVLLGMQEADVERPQRLELGEK